MKSISLAGTAFLALLALEPAAHAQRVNFTYTAKLVTYTVPANGLYRITAYGAQGGNATVGNVVGGLGAEIGGDFALTAGKTLEIAVGGAGMDGGGGAVALSWSAPIIRRWSSPVRAAGPEAALVALVAPTRAAAPLAVAGAAPVMAGRAVTAEEVAVRSGASAAVAVVVASSAPVVMASVHLAPLAAPEGAAAPSQILLEAAVAASSASPAGTGALVAAEAPRLIQVGVEAAALAVVVGAHLASGPLGAAVAARSTRERTRSKSPASKPAMVRL